MFGRYRHDRSTRVAAIAVAAALAMGAAREASAQTAETNVGTATPSASAAPGANATGTVRGSVSIGAPVEDVAPTPVRREVRAFPASPPPTFQTAYYPPGTVTPYRGGEVPPGARVENRTSRAATVAGAAIFFGAWGLNAVLGLVFTPLDPAFATFAIPVVGPLVAAVVFSSRSGVFSSGPTLVVAGVLDTLVQGAGLAVFIAGLTITRPMLVWGPSVAGRPSGLRVAVAPVATGGAPGATPLGASVLGVF